MATMSRVPVRTTGDAKEMDVEITKQALLRQGGVGGWGG